MAEGSRRATLGNKLPTDVTQDYDAADDVRTLARAHAIRKDPKRHARAKAHIKALSTAVDPEGDTVSPMMQQGKAKRY